MKRLITTLVAALFTCSTPLKSALAQTDPATDTVIKNRVILTVSERGDTRVSAFALFEQVKNAIMAEFPNDEIRSINFLYPSFCALVGENNSTSIATHLKLLNEGFSTIPVLSEQRIQTIKAYLAKPGAELCNQFVVTAKEANSEQLAETLSHLKFMNSLVLEDLQPVHQYQVNKDTIASLVESKLRPDSLIGVISSLELNKKFYGLRAKNAKEVADDGIDNDENAYIDDICGINSNEYEPEFNFSTRNGYMTLAVARDRNQNIEYSTVEAAQALLYAIHRCPEQVLIPFSKEDKILSDLMDRSYQLGIRQLKPRAPAVSDSNTTTKTTSKTSGKSATTKKTNNITPANAGELVNIKISNSDESRACSYYVDAKNKLSTFISRVDGKKLFGKSDWSKLSLRSGIAGIDSKIAELGSKTDAASAKKLKKLKTQRKQMAAAQKDLNQCMADRRNAREAAPISFSVIKPILQQKCFSCHMTRDWTENSEEFYLKTMRVIPKQPGQSALYAYLRNNPEGYQPANMPEGSGSLSTLQIALIRQWINGLSDLPSSEPTATPTPTPNPLAPLKDGQRLYNENCMSCHMDLAHSTKFGTTFEKIKTALDPDTGTFSMRSLGRVLSDEQIRLITLALNTKVDSESENWTLNIGTGTYVASVFRSVFLPDNTTTFTSQDTTINTQITQAIFATDKLKFFGGICDRFETSCLPEGEGLDQKPAPNVLRTGHQLRLLDQLLSPATNNRAINNALSKVGRTITSDINGQAVKDLYTLIYPGHTISDETADSIAQTIKSVPGYMPIDYWRFLIKFLFASGHWEVF